MTQEHFDVLAIGAGISGIGAGVYLTQRCPGKSFVILERRARVGGTWDLFRYPGIRSDSDMYTFGYQFKPWLNPKMISDGESIRGYLEETAREYGLFERIRFGIKVLRASWSSQAARWTIEAVNESSGESLRFTCGFLVGATGYYNYDQGYTPEFPGRERFRGAIVHPQHWPADLDYTGKRVVVIGSGATAITLVPSMAPTAAHVTMLQRSPTYVLSRPERDVLTNQLLKVLPPMLVYRWARAKNVSLQLLMHRLSLKYPKPIRRLLLAGVRRSLPAKADLRHFAPRYNPWDERLCVVPDGDLFAAMRQGKASVVTGEIDTFTERGIALKSGETLEADIIVTATGLNLQVLGGVALEVDGAPYAFAGKLSYKSIMFENLPNFAILFGYPNQSWTMKIDLACEFVCRLLNYMERKGTPLVTPRNRDAGVERTPFMDLKSGYVKRAAHLMPFQGSKFPWRLYNNYWLDLVTLRYSKVDDGSLEFARAPGATAPHPAA